MGPPNDAAQFNYKVFSNGSEKLLVPKINQHKSAAERAHSNGGLTEANSVIDDNHSLSNMGSGSFQNVELMKQKIAISYDLAINDAGASSDHDDDEEEIEVSYPEDYVVGYGVDNKDEGTADSWIKRHPELVRLTGRHPFNCEPPLSRLMEHAFLTPTSLHYVRNHGYVPKIMASFDEWSVQISGLVKRPQTLTMAQIVNEFKPRELPVTLVCAGNRRKEQNMVQQTIGFNWGAAGTGTSMWREMWCAWQEFRSPLCVL